MNIVALQTRRAVALALFSLGLGCGRVEPVVAPVLPGADDGATPAAFPTKGADAGARGARDAGAGVAQGAKTLFVREVLAECEGEGPTTCMQVRDSAGDGWSLYYGSIEDFTYEPGYAYELHVETKNRTTPAADGPASKLRLVAIVSKQKIAH